jgi:5-methylcytosine-specific restriction endonuclease McrA
MKNEILRLRSEGKSYRQIEKELGCSRSSISYHCGSGQKEKSRGRNRKHRALKPFQNKILNYRNRKAILDRSKNFRIDYGRGKKSESATEEKFGVSEVMERVGPNPVCYLTGTPIDLSKSSTYRFDHVFPRSKGGSNTLDNLGLTTTQANAAKGSMEVAEFIDLCRKVLINFGYSVEKLS